MTQEEKQIQIRLIDLCARLPYRVMVQSVGENKILGLVDLSNPDLFLPKPYLRPMSSMTEEEKDTFQSFIYPACNDPVSMIDWLNKHHFDYRGLIEKGLALEALEGMYK